MHNGLNNAAELVVFVDERNFHGRRPSTIFRMCAFKRFLRWTPGIAIPFGVLLKLMQILASVSSKICRTVETLGA
jgi:hypothetical protein